MEIKNFCPECGNKLDSGSKFCPNCGFNLTTGETSPYNTAVSQAVAPTNSTAMRITQQPNTSDATDNENYYFIKKQKDEVEKLRKQVKGSYIALLICLVVLVVVVCVGGGWFWQLVKWIIFVPGWFMGVIVSSSVAVNLNLKRKKVEKMSLIEYKHELVKRERNKEMAVDAAKGFAKGFAQAYIREKFRNY